MAYDNVHNSRKVKFMILKGYYYTNAHKFNFEERELVVDVIVLKMISNHVNE